MVDVCPFCKNPLVEREFPRHYSNHRPYSGDRRKVKECQTKDCRGQVYIYELW